MDSRFRGNDGWGRVAQGAPLGGEAGGGALRAPARLPARALSQSPPEGERPEGRAPTRGAPTGGMDSRFRGNDGWGRVVQGLPLGKEAGGGALRAPARLSARALSQSPPQGERPEGRAPTRGAPTGGRDSRFRGNDGWGRVAQGLPLGGEAGGGALWAPARLSARALSQSPPQGERPEGRVPTRGAPTGGRDSRFRGNDGVLRGHHRVSERHGITPLSRARTGRRPGYGLVRPARPGVDSAAGFRGSVRWEAPTCRGRRDRGSRGRRRGCARGRTAAR